MTVTLRGDQLLKEFELVIKRLRIEPDTQVTMDVTEQVVIVTPIRPDTIREADFQKAMEKTEQRFAETFRALAK